MNDKEQFITDLYPAAAKVSQETGMSKELILAQAALETGWGEKVLPDTNNIFNIKASPDWHGPTKTFLVPEFEHGKKVMVNAEFRVYGSVEESLQDRVKFLQDNPRYAKSGLFDPGTRGNLEKEANALQKAGYATDPKYAEQLAAVYNGPTMQRAIKQAQEQSAMPEHRQTTSANHANTASHGALPMHGQGDNNTVVRQLQTDLSRLGYKDGHGQPLKADGDFGLDTRHAVEKFQRNHHLVVDGKAGPKTMEALHAETQAKTAPGLDDPKNPDHALYEKALAGVSKLDAQAGRTSDQYSANLAAALVVAAKKEGLTRIDDVVLSTDEGSRVFAVQHGMPLQKFAQVPTLPSLNTPIEKSSAETKQIHQQQAQQAVQPAAQRMIPAPAEPAPAMSR